MKALVLVGRDRDVTSMRFGLMSRQGFGMFLLEKQGVRCYPIVSVILMFVRDGGEGDVFVLMFEQERWSFGGFADIFETL